MSKAEFGALVGIISNFNSLSQTKIVPVASQAAMLAREAKVDDIIVRTDDNNYQYRLTALPANALANWEALGKSAPPIGETVLDIITTNEAIAAKVDGLYAFAGSPAGGFPAGVAQGDIASKVGAVWTLAYTFLNAPATIFSVSDGKTYLKAVNGAGVNTWQPKSESSVYRVGPDEQYTTLQAAVDAYQADFTSGKLSVGVIQTFQTLINESVTIGGSADIQNLMIEGYGVQGSANVQITKLTLGAFSHRIKLKNLIFTNTVASPPLVIQSAGNCTENGVANTPRGKHFLDCVSIATPNATSFDVQSCDNFLVLNNCDFGGTTKIVNIANKTGAPTTISIDGCNNGLLNVGNNRIVTKNNSTSVYRGTISASAVVLDIDTATPIAYSILRSYTALGATVPVALGSMIINDDVGGGLQNLKCKTAYTIAGNLGVGTAIDLTKYDVQASMTVTAVKTANFTATKNTINPINTTSASVTALLPLAANSTAGDVIRFTDYANTFATNNLIINPNGGKINGSNLNVAVTTNNADPEIIYIDATEGWALRLTAIAPLQNAAVSDLVSQVVYDATTNQLKTQAVVVEFGAVLDNTITTPPASPSIGDRYLVPSAGATGAWAGLGNNLVEWSGLAWAQTQPVANATITIAAGTNAGAVLAYKVAPTAAWVPAPNAALVIPQNSVTNPATAVGSIYLDLTNKTVDAMVETDQPTPLSTINIVAMLTIAPTGANVTGLYTQITGTLPTAMAGSKPLSLGDIYYWNAATLTAFRKYSYDKAPPSLTVGTGIGAFTVSKFYGSWFSLTTRKIPHAFRAKLGTGPAIPFNNSTITKVIFTISEYDVSGMYSTVTGLLTAKQTGLHIITAGVRFSAASPTPMNGGYIYLYKNNAFVSILSQTELTTATLRAVGNPNTFSLVLNANDNIDIRVFAYGGAGYTISVDSYFSAYFAGEVA